MEIPGRLYVVATLLPLAAFFVLLVAGGVRAACRPFRRQGGFAGSLYWVCGGDKPLKTGAYLATGCMAVAAALAVYGLLQFISASDESRLRGGPPEPVWAERRDFIRIGPPDTHPPQEWERLRRDDPNRPVPRL